MESTGYTQNHLLSDVRLGLGYTGVIAVAAAALYEYKVGFQEAKATSLLGVGTYFLLNLALYFWGWFMEGETVYVGKKGDMTVNGQ